MVILVCLLGYVLGSIPFALIVGKGWYKVDVREHGSGNLGATNTLAVLGLKPGLIVALGDMTKGVVACTLPVLFKVDISPLLIGCCAIVGHSFPVFARFRGGKAIATLAGVFLFVSPLYFLVGVIVFASAIYISKYVAVGSLVGGFSLLALALIEQKQFSIIICSLIFIFLLFLHRSNIRNLINGVEPTVYDKNKFRVNQ